MSDLDVGVELEEESAIESGTATTEDTLVIFSPGIDVPVACPGQGTNTPGSYLSEPQCYQFNVDLRIVPGFDYRPGLYRLLLNFVISEDL